MNVKFNHSRGVWCVYGTAEERAQVKALTGGIEELKIAYGLVREHESFVQVEVSPLTYQQLVGLGATFTEAAALQVFEINHKLASLDRAAHTTDNLPEFPTLRHYQTAGARWLSTVGRGLLLDKTGLGKTIQTIITCHYLAQAEPLKILVVCPNPIRRQWFDEFTNWLNNNWAYYLPASGSDSTFRTWDHSVTNVVIVNWEKLQRNSTLREALLNVGWNVVVADEFHRAKDRNSSQSKMIYKIARQQSPEDYFFGLTATPTDGSPDQYWALLRCLDPERFTAYWRWYEMFVDYQWDHNHRYRVVNKFNGSGGVKFKAILDSVLKQYGLRREKVEGIPPIVRQTLDTDFNPDQKKMYDEMRKWARTITLDGDEIVAPGVLAKLIRLRQITTWPHIIDGPEEFPKLDVLIDFLSDLDPGMNVVVYSCFQESVREIANRINTKLSAQWTARTYTGNDPASAAEISDWLKTPHRVLITTPFKGGVGANFQAASVLVWVDRPYSSIDNEQAEGRLPRQGSTADYVLMVDIVIRNSTDDYISKLLQSKHSFNETSLGALVIKYLQTH